jgi:hypothetical protein
MEKFSVLSTALAADGYVPVTVPPVLFISASMLLLTRLMLSVQRRSLPCRLYSVHVNSYENF